MHKLTPIAAYARTNNKNTKSSFCGSIKKQLSAIRSWAKSNNCIVVNEYEDECVSGFTYNSVNLTNLVKDIKSNQIQIEYVVVFSNTRISRNMETLLWFEEEMKLAKVKIVSLSDRAKFEFMRETSAQSLCFKSFDSVFNDCYKRRKSKESAMKLNDIAKQGFFTGGIAPYGYQSVTVVTQQFGYDKERKVLVLHPENAKIVKKIFKLYLSKESEDPLDTHEIALYLNSNNLLKNGKIWTKCSVCKILKSTLYTGKREYGRNRKRNDLNKEVVLIAIPPVISEKDFYQAEQKLLIDK